MAALAIFGWLCLVLICGWLSFAFVAGGRLILGFGGGASDRVVVALFGLAALAGWCAVVWLAPFSITLS